MGTFKSASRIVRAVEKAGEPPAEDTPPDHATKFRKGGKPLKKPIAIHCPYCQGKVIFVRSEDHLDKKNCPHCGMEVERKWGLA